MLYCRGKTGYTLCLFFFFVIIIRYFKWENTNEMNKKNIVYILLCILLIFCVGCGKDKKDNTEAEQNVKQDMQTDSTDTKQEAIATADVPEKDADGFIVTDDYVKTTEMTVNVRVSPSTDAAIYKLLEEGAVIQRTGYNDEWTRVWIDNTNFYVYSDYVVETEAPEGVEEESSEEETTEQETEDEKTRVKKIVIDPANQANVNAAQEQLGPGSEATKQGATTGSVGVAYGTKEYELNLQYANLLKAELENRGYEVYITRESNNVNMTNKERAEFANDSGATVFIRLQVNYSSNNDMTGVMALCMSDDSPYNSELYAESYELSTRIIQGITEATGAVNHGIYESEEMTAINWSEIPVAVINLGFISNANEEASLVSDEYKATMIDGIANGIDYYFGE